jgi:hypothetical protein
MPHINGIDDGVGYGVKGESDVTSVTIESVGVWGNAPNGTGVSGSSDNGTGVAAVSKAGAGVIALSNSGEGVYGQGRNGVHGRSASATDSGVWGENTGSGWGVSGNSNGGDGIIGQGGRNGVHGRSASATDSGVWGENTGSGWGVGANSHGGDGIIGQGARNGVVGRTASGSDSGVWGDNTGSGYGVAGHSASGIGVLGQGGRLAGRFEGNVEVTGDISLVNQDCAEDFEISSAREVEPGTVMVIETGGALQVSESAYDRRVAGVISGGGNFKPGIVLGRQQSLDKSGERVPIALLGRTYCKVDAGSSPIEVGDLLTTSSIPGHAMKAVDPLKAFGAVIGKALQDLREGQGLIPILIALQ